MYLITTSEQLAAIIPNTTVTVTGETPLLTKLTPFLESSELWLSDTFLSAEILADISTRPDSDTLRTLTEQALAYDAFHRAIPHLDIILTPNGFGIVSNSNIAPASKERVERLLDMLLENRDNAITQLLTVLSKSPEWIATEQAGFFRATKFPDPSLASRFPQSPKGHWEQYLILRQQLLKCEVYIATHYLSAPLMVFSNLETFTRKGTNFMLSISFFSEIIYICTQYVPRIHTLAHAYTLE